MRRGSERGGSSLLEFVLVGIPLVFILISTIEIARAMWTYHTLAFSVKSATRYTIVHGSNCAQSPNSCTVTIGQIASVMQSAGLGLDTSRMSVTFTPAAGSATSCTLSDCLTNSTQWPPSTVNSPGNNVTITATYPFNSIIALLWPGTTGGVTSIGSVNFPASSRDIMQF